MGIPVPKEYGGQGCDILTYIMCVEELSKVCGTTGVVVSAHTSLCVDPILTYGTEDQKQKYLPDLAAVKNLVLSVLQSRVQVQMLRVFRQKLFLMADEWVLTVLSASLQTVKLLTFISSSLIQTLLKKERQKIKKFSAFIVEKGTPGFTFGTKEKKMGIRGSSTYELSSRIAVSLKMHFLDLRAKVSLSLCILWMVDVSVSLPRHLVLQRVHSREQSSTQKKENSLAVQSLSSRIHSSSLLIWLQR